MIKDFLDVCTPKTRFTATGKYYTDFPYDPKVAAQTFHYEYESTYSNVYRRLFGNIQDDGGEVAIRTDDRLCFKTDGIVVTQDGLMFKIAQAEKDFGAASKQAFRLLGMPVSVEYVLKLKKIENPWGIGK